MRRQKYKIQLDEEQLKIVRKMVSEKKKLILHDKDSIVTVESTNELVPMHLFNSIEMTGLLVYKKIGPDEFAYKLNQNVLQKVSNL